MQIHWTSESQHHNLNSPTDKPIQEDTLRRIKKNVRRKVEKTKEAVGSWNENPYKLRCRYEKALLYLYLISCILERSLTYSDTVTVHIRNSSTVFTLHYLQASRKDSV